MTTKMSYGILEMFRYRVQVPLQKHSHRTIDASFNLQATVSALARDKEGNIKKSLLSRQHDNSDREKNQ